MERSGRWAFSRAGVVLMGAAFAALACVDARQALAPGADAPAQYELQHGTADLEVTVATTGSDLDPDGYLIVVDGTLEQGVGINQTVLFSGLGAGDHTVALHGVADNCVIIGGKTRTVTLTSGTVTRMTFSVSCGTVNLEVTTATSGSALDPDDYLVVVDGATEFPIEINGRLRLSLAQGDHTVKLTGVAANCTVIGGEIRTVTITAGTVARVAFEVTCEGVTPGPGETRETSKSPWPPQARRSIPTATS